MMMTTELVSANALLVANALLLGAAAIELLRLKRIVKRFGRTRNGKTTAAAAQAQSPGAPSQLVERRILALEKIADELSRKEQVLERQVRQTATHEDAVKMAGKGASIDDLIRTCGLNRGEAQLMVRLYANRQML